MRSSRPRPKVPVPFGPEIEEPLGVLVHAGHVIFAAGIDQKDANLRVLRQPPCHDRPDEPDPRMMKSYCDFISDDSLD
jgi:hypothetical protein